MLLAAGTRLGRYEIRSLVGEGGMGEVYLARDSQLERTVALKILRAQVSPDRDRMRRFVQEAKTTSALNHPNIITVHEVGQTPSIFFIATEYIDGHTLRAELKKGPMRTARYEEALALFKEIDNRLAVAYVLNNLGNVAKDRGDYLRAWQLHEEALALFRDLGDKRALSTSLYNLAEVAQYRGDYERASALQTESLVLKREVGDKRGCAATTRARPRSTARAWSSSARRATSAASPSAWRAGRSRLQAE